MLTFLKKEEKENIVLFIHGFKGGKETWMSGTGPSLFIQYLMQVEKVQDHYDFALFDYFTKITDAFQKVKALQQLFNPSAKVEKNLSIDDLSDLLLTEVDVTLANYKKIVLVGHSMGGLVSKSYILKALKKESKVHLYISMAVPHNGAKLADLAKIIFNSPQIENLRPLEEYNNQITKQWIANRDRLPKTIYHQGKLDNVVSQTSSIGYDAREDVTVIYSNHGHSTIVRPELPDDVVVHSTIKALVELVDAPLLSSIKPNLQTSKPKEMDPVSSSVMIASIVGYLTKKVKDNKSVTGFLNDFTAATVAWIRPLFLTNDEESKPKELIQDLIKDPIDEQGFNRQAIQIRLEKALRDDKNLLSYIEQMYEVINAKKEEGEDVGVGGDIIINGDWSTIVSHNKNSTITISNSSTGNPEPPSKTQDQGSETTDN